MNGSKRENENESWGGDPNMPYPNSEPVTMLACRRTMAFRFNTVCVAYAVAFFILFPNPQSL